ncbi:MAG: DUF3820 family protein [Campylobacterota bacterium]|nr:DUF3820 family protein [Campylobacterota bacterium]
MIKAHLIFTHFTNSYSVHIPNLEQLSVEQIQQLQGFVSSRNGIFDFNKYSFVIQKRLEFFEFLSLIRNCGIKAVCEENIIIKQTQPRIGFGQYKGMQYNELPDSYIFWLKTNYRGYERDIIDKELKKRNL